MRGVFSERVRVCSVRRGVFCEDVFCEEEVLVWVCSVCRYVSVFSVGVFCVHVCECVL